jgi:hypothetical protein
MSAEEQVMNITKCTRCHMRHKDDMFGTNRLGEKFKTCNTCREKNRGKNKAYNKAYREANKDKIAIYQKTYKDKNQCEHGLFKDTCYTCGSGPRFCVHKLPPKRCETCTPSNFCQHSKLLVLKCRSCNPELFCHHDNQIEYCRPCRQESKKKNPHLHCAVEGHCGLVNECVECRWTENNKGRLRLKKAAEEADMKAAEE